jgi:1-pyrroline-5-carboxylate dehydrogenase
MNNSLAPVPPAVNEPVLSYAPGSPERASLKKKLASLKSNEVDVPAFIGGREVRTGDTEAIRPPHETSHTLGHVHQCGEEDIQQAIQAALDARHDWARMHWTDRAAIFLKAAELLAGPWRDTLNGATMLGQSKNAYQAEIDAACELIDFLRFNVQYMQEIYENQPASSRGIWNRLQYRPLEGFVFAVTPFNFTAIAGNLPTAPALMGNTVVWKPATSAIYSAYYLYRLLEAAGLPPGVINLVPGHGPPIGKHVFAHPQLSGLHFTGSTGTFQHMWRTIGGNIASYRSYPRIVGETGGKDFILAHPSADVTAVATAIVRGAFEYQGQKCSAASRVYIPRSIWPDVERELLGQLEEVEMGTVEDFSNFVNAVIDRPAYDSITGYIDQARRDGVTVLAGGDYSDEEGFFIEPTVLLTEDPLYRTMCEEIFGPVVSLYVFDDARWDDTLKLLDESSPYALTGAVFAQDRRALAETTERLRDNAGNFYLNDKPTGAVVNQQPFGGARASGTNDKAGSYLNLLRWTSARSIKENFNPPHHFSYPFLGSDSIKEKIGQILD